MSEKSPLRPCDRDFAELFKSTKRAFLVNLPTRENMEPVCLSVPFLTTPPS